MYLLQVQHVAVLTVKQQNGGTKRVIKRLEPKESSARCSLKKSYATKTNLPDLIAEGSRMTDS